MPLDGAARAALIALIENSAKQAVLEGSGMPKPPSLASAAETQYVPPTEALLQGARVNNPVRTVLELRPRAAVTLEGSVSVADAAKRMAAANADAALVLGDEDRVAGIFTDRDLASRVLGAGLDPRRTKISAIMTENPRCVMDDEPALTAVMLMVDGRFRHLPVVDSTESVVGLLDVAKCLHDAISHLELRNLAGGQRTAGELLRATAPPDSTVLADATVVAAAKQAASRKGGAALVVRSEGGGAPRVGGIVTPKDFLNRVVAVGLAAARTRVGDIMTPSPACIKESATLLHALHLLQGSGFRNLPVVSEAGEPLGVLDVLAVVEGALEAASSTDAPPTPARRPLAHSAVGDYAPASEAFTPFGSPLAPGFFLFKACPLARSPPRPAARTRDRPGPPSLASVSGLRLWPPPLASASPSLPLRLPPAPLSPRQVVVVREGRERLLRLRCAEESLSGLEGAVSCKRGRHRPTDQTPSPRDFPLLEGCKLRGGDAGGRTRGCPRVGGPQAARRPCRAGLQPLPHRAHRRRDRAAASLLRRRPRLRRRRGQGVGPRPAAAPRRVRPPHRRAPRPLCRRGGAGGGPRRLPPPLCARRRSGRRRRSSLPRPQALRRLGRPNPGRTFSRDGRERVVGMGDEREPSLLAPSPLALRVYYSAAGTNPPPRDGHDGARTTVHAPRLCGLAVPAAEALSIDARGVCTISV